MNDQGCIVLFMQSFNRGNNMLAFNLNRNWLRRVFLCRAE